MRDTKTKNVIKNSQLTSDFEKISSNKTIEQEQMNSSFWVMADELQVRAILAVNRLGRKPSIRVLHEAPNYVTSATTTRLLQQLRHFSDKQESQ